LNCAGEDTGVILDPSSVPESLSREPAPGPARADLHVHTRYSDRPSEAWLRAIGAAESYVEPEEVYRRAKARGMTFVTISDHNRIDGALAIAHHGDVFLSSELTVHFPRGGSAFHCLVTGMDEEQFRELDRLRFDVYALRDYLLEQKLFHAVAHPLYRVDDRMTVEEFEQLVLLFNTFEGLNGMHGLRVGEPLVGILRGLTPGLLDKLADAHGIEPVGDDPWRKTFVGGSDDHTGLFLASAWTETPPAGTVEEFLAHLRRGDARYAGTRGSAKQLARGLGSIAHAYYHARFERRRDAGCRTLAEMLRGLGGEPRAARRWRPRLALRRLGPEERAFRRMRALADGAEGCTDKAFDMLARIGQTMVAQTIGKAAKELARGRLFQGVRALAGVAPAALGMAPYVAALRAQYKDEPFVAALAERFAAADLVERSPKKAWLTDTLPDLNGVSRTIRTLAARARTHGLPLTVVTSHEDHDGDASAAPAPPFDHVNFAPLAAHPIPQYPQQRVVAPPFLEMIDYLDREAFGEVILSTPGPVGLVGLLAARLLGLRTCGIYHTDFPAYARDLTGDAAAGAFARGSMKWFYGQLDAVFVRSEAYRRQLVDWGLPSESIAVLSGGVDSDRFHPRFRKRTDGAEANTFTLLYVGRVSREKNLDVLADAFLALRRARDDVRLVVVGDGPHEGELRRRLSGSGATFTGRLGGDALSTAYASADLFVFPSRTDTFGNVVLEAHASGLPALVAPEGGPADIVRERGSGLVVDMTDPVALAGAVAGLVDDPARRRRLADAALATARARSWDAVLERLWTVRGERPPRNRRLDRDLAAS